MEFTGLRRVRVFSVPRVVLFLPVGSFFPKFGWCSSSWVGVPRTRAVFCSHLLFLFQSVRYHGAVICAL